MYGFIFWTIQFLSTPSARRATSAFTTLGCSDRFLSTPSARRATQAGGKGRHSGHISIHALREEGDKEIRIRVIHDALFLSTPSARRATRQREFARWPIYISIHALREEGDNNAPEDLR